MQRFSSTVAKLSCPQCHSILRPRRLSRFATMVMRIRCSVARSQMKLANYPLSLNTQKVRTLELRSLRLKLKLLLSLALRCLLRHSSTFSTMREINSQSQSQALLTTVFSLFTVSCRDISMKSFTVSIRASLSSWTRVPVLM